MGYSWEQALAAVLVSGVLYLISLTGLRAKVVQAAPQSLKYAIGAGIGFFIALYWFGSMLESLFKENGTPTALGDLTSPVALIY